jgi:hypothetical protein
MIKRIKSSQTLISLIILFILVSGSFLLKLTTVNVGAETVNYPNFHHFPDETGNLWKALRIGEGKVIIGYISSLFYYFLFLFYSLVFVILKVSGTVASLGDFQEFAIIHTDKLLFAGRLLVSFIGSLTVGLVYWIGERIYSRKVGLISALFLFFSLGHFVKSTELRIDILLTFFYVLSAYLLYLILKNPEKIRYSLISGLTVGIAASFKINGLIAVLTFGILFLILFIRQDIPRIQIIKSAALFFIALCLTFAVFNFPSLSSPAFKAYSNALSSARFGSLCYQTPYSHSFLFYITRILPRMVSWPLILGFFFSSLAVPFLRAKDKTLIILLLFMFYSYLAIAGWYTRASWRDILPVIPIIYLVFSFFLASTIHKKKSLLLSGIVIAMLFFPVFNMYSHIELLQKVDTREQAKTWIEANIPGGTSLSIQNYGPPLTRNRESMYRYWDKEGERIKYHLKNYNDLALSYDIHLFSKWIDPYTRKDDRHFEESFLHYLGDNKIKYLILSSRSYSRWFSPAADVHMEENAALNVRQYYQIIEKKLDLIEEFIPDRKRMPGPVIKIYLVPDNIESFDSSRTFEPHLKTGDGTIGYYWH